MHILDISESECVAGGTAVLTGEGILFGAVSLASAVTGLEPIAIAAGAAALAADGENAAFG